MSNFRGLLQHVRRRLIIKTKAYINDEITITATPAAGYELDTIKVNSKAINGNKFTMGAENATVTVTFKIIEYTVTVDKTTNGTVTVNKPEAYAGDEITITATPAEGYEIDTIKVNGKTISGNKFTMGAENATVTATFKERTGYSITVSNSIYGTVTVSKTKAYAGEEIIVSVTPEYGYMLDEIKINKAPIDGYKFIMPAENVTVSVTFYAAVDYGKCGYHLTWALSEDGVLVISGYGDMYDYDAFSDYGMAPWNRYYYSYSDGDYNGIRAVHFEGQITHIGEGAFSGCYRLKKITIPGSVTSIGEYAFEGCFFDSVTISDGVTSIGDCAFTECYITKLTIPKSVKRIGEFAFGTENYEMAAGITGHEVCTIENIYYEGTEEDWKEISIGSDNYSINHAPIYLADGSVIRATNTLWTYGYTVKLKYKKLRKKTQKIARSKAMTIDEPEGKVTYQLTSVSKKKYKKYFKVNAANGVITVKKKLKKGTYTLKVKVTAAGNANYKPLSRTVTVKVKVK